MSRLVIDVSGEQHQQIKALAALQGKTIKEFILEKVFSSNSEENDEKAAWAELEELLASRIQKAGEEGTSAISFEQISEDIIRTNKK